MLAVVPAGPNARSAKLISWEGSKGTERPLIFSYAQLPLQRL